MRLNILFITLDFPYPLNAGGNVAIFYRIKELSKRGHNIFLFSASPSTINKETIKSLKKYCRYIKVYTPRKTEVLFNLFRFPLLPISGIRRYSKKMQRDINAFLISQKIDILFIEHSIMAIYLPKDHLKTIKSILVLHALGYKSLFRLAKELPIFSIKKLIYYIESLKMKRFEYNIFKLNKFDEFWFYSIDDINDILRKTRKSIKNKIKLIPIGTEPKIDFQVKQKIFPGVSLTDKVILTIGCMDSPINEDYVRWFVKDIFPKIKKNVPKAKFCIIGKNSKNKLKDIVSKDIIVVGEVSDLKPYLNRCDLYVVPVRTGAGLRVKLLDGFSARKIIITTPIGIEAIKDIKPNIHLLLAKNEEEFANKAIDVLKNPRKYNYIAENGFKFFKENFSVETVGAVIENNLISIVQSERLK